MDRVTCGGCLWWKRDEGGQGGDKGKCHRYAPRATTGCLEAAWATTERTDYCGEAVPQPDTTPIEMR